MTLFLPGINTLSKHRLILSFSLAGINRPSFADTHRLAIDQLCILRSSYE